MLSVILKILSILGIILLVLLGLIILALLLVLFFPIFYRIKADRNLIEDSAKYATHAEIKASWLFGLLRARYKYPDPGVLQVKILFFTLYDSGKVAEESVSNVDKPDKAVDTTNTAASDTKASNAKTSDAKASEAKTSSRRTVDTETEYQQNQKMGIIDKIQYTIQNFCDKIKDILDKLRNIRENIEYYREILLCEDTKSLLKHAFTRLGKILKSIRPRKLRANIRFGAASPDTTGYVCAAYGILCSYLGKHVFFTPDFEQAILTGDVDAAGHITVFKVLWNVLMVVKDRRLWELKEKLTKK